jgi:hypothetical protein
MPIEDHFRAIENLRSQHNTEHLLLYIVLIIINA